MTIHDSFEIDLAAAWAPDRWRDETVVVAVSGGADSVALLRGLVAIKGDGPGRLIAAHVNHGLRREESDADQAFVRELARQLRVPCETARIDAAAVAARQGDGLEAAARTARYEYLIEAAEANAARYVATAHTADDQIETILMRIFRGTGLSGLSGIPRDRALSPAVTLIRPLLGVRRRKLLAYLDRLGQSYREDSSNEDLRHSRNWIRHELLPRLTSEYDDHAADAVLRLGKLAAEAQEVIAGATEELVDKAVTKTDAGVEIDCAAFGEASNYVVRELMLEVWRSSGWPLQSMGLAQWERLAHLALSETGHAETIRETFPGTVVAMRSGDRLLLERDEQLS